MGDVLPFKPRDPIPPTRPPMQIAWGEDSGKRVCFASFPDILCMGVGDDEEEAVEQLAHILADFVRGHADTIRDYRAKLVAAGLLPRE